VPCQGPKWSGRGAGSGDGGVESDSCAVHDGSVTVILYMEVGDMAKAGGCAHDLNEF
jgi:hypothetical protein